MPIWIHLSNLIVLKKAVAAKYPGGLDAFRDEYDIENPENYQQEDGELFSLSAMDPDLQQGDAGRLIDMGFNFDEIDCGANELAILTRYGGVAARPPWLQFNTLYAWHMDCSPALQTKARTIMGKTVDEVVELLDRGDLPRGALVE